MTDKNRPTYRRVGPYLEVSEEVAAALTARRGVVALESTIIAHGMPYPQNLETALVVEEIIRGTPGMGREAGPVPATIAVFDGVARVGCSRADLESLARGGRDIPKASLRDLPVLYARRATGATTVASTATITAQAGLRVFVTGGIGGVHRGWETTLDVSADLEVLGRVPLAVVSAGAKSVLDIPATLEYLETKGVTVLGLGTDRFPGFHLRETPHPVDARVESVEEAAAIVAARIGSGLPGSVLLTVPLAEADAVPSADYDEALGRALAAVDAGGVKGKEVTPFLLEALKSATGGRSLESNITLIKNNARVGAELAAALAGLL